eukprot:TRINITY_DN5954_c0_g1_i1.p1 TRINITY_DN5954_c0_g1~~TRINITY_DN5954_c0_g1_i1.p1  ORF type:complete len:494 (-),score=82.83 TRINITY_DN5954_c0_g1_i1:57-1493(-)
MQRIYSIVLVALVCAVTALAQETCPGVDMTALRAERERVLYIWVSRMNYDQQYMLDAYDNFTTSDDGNPEHVHEFIIDTFGSYHTRIVAEEYALLAVDPNVFQLFTLADPVSLRWTESNIVWYKAITNYTFNFMPTKPTYDGFINDNLLKFEPCTAKIWVDLSRQDVLVARAIVQDEQNLPASVICGIIQSACVGANQVYDSQAACEDFIGNLGTSPCPSGQLTNTSNCYFFHATAASYLPDYHCPHVRPGYHPKGPSVKCVDFCLTEGCGNCHADAHCEFKTPFGQLTPSYTCVCNDGYSGDGTDSCVENSCTADYDCPSQTPFVDCINNRCHCAESFYWNTSAAAASQAKSCGCLANENLVWTNGVPECVPIGRCRAGHREDCTIPMGPHSWNSVKCREYGSNVLLDHLYKTCLCNYGYDNLGFALACQCSSPKREVWDAASQGNLCLKPTECTENYHCSSGRCNKAVGATVGTCA